MAGRSGCTKHLVSFALTWLKDYARASNGSVVRRGGEGRGGIPAWRLDKQKIISLGEFDRTLTQGRDCRYLRLKF